MRKQNTIIDNAKEATMKFYIAGYSGFDPDDMDYKKLGGDKDLYTLFPELKEVMHLLKMLESGQGLKGS